MKLIVTDKRYGHSRDEIEISICLIFWQFKLFRGLVFLRYVFSEEELNERNK